MEFYNMEFNIGDALENAYEQGYAEGKADAERSHTIYTEPSNMTIDMPDMVQVVRCKDCKHKYTQYDVCDFMDAQFDENGYCHHGERIDNE